LPVASVSREVTRGTVTTARRAANLLKHQTLKQLKLRQGASRASVDRFDEILETEAAGHSTVFVHAGLSDISSAFETNPYEFLMDRLDDHFENIIATGFTDYFKHSGVYHKEHSRPKNGTFVELFHDDADYRTDDAMKSFLVKGEYRFEDCVHHDSYHENGCFSKLVDDDVLVFDVGTHWITCSHLHYFESAFDVDYVQDVTYEGVDLTGGSPEPIQQTCGEYESMFYSWNKPKLQRLLLRHDALAKYDLNGLLLCFFTLGDVERLLGAKLRDDPYYLVTL
jgi:aminoglycoside N3'-acetyltransferase